MAPQHTEEGKVFEDYINFLIDKKLESHESSIKKEDAQEIIETLMPEIEKLVSKIVIQHIRSFATILLKKLKEE